MIRRLGLIGLLAAALVVATAGPASAHTISGPRPTNFRSRVVSVAPPVPGVGIRMVELGAKVELTNDTNSEITVFGYEGEPYLRVGPSGVFENIHSAAVYINRSLKGGVVPSGVNTGPEVAPEWRKISDAHTVHWHDHRTHWMETTLPPVVQNASGSFHRIFSNTITMTRDGRTITATVELDWVPGPSPVPWIPVAVVAFVLGLLVVLRSQWWRVLALALGVLVAIDIVHTVAYEMARAGETGAKVLQFFGGSFVSIIVWIAAIPTIVGVLRRRSEALFGALFVGLMVALVGGATDVTSLWKSQLPPVGPDWLTRAEVAVALGLGAGVAIGALVRLVRSDHGRRSETREQRREWLATLVVGLSDSELRRIAAELDVDDVLGAALGDLSVRLQNCEDAFTAGAIVLDIAADDDTGLHTWSLTPAASRGRAEPVATELALPFPLLLQLLAGTVALDDAVASGRVRATGDASVVARVAPFLGERATPRDRAPAS